MNKIKVLAMTYLLEDGDEEWKNSLYNYDWYKFKTLIKYKCYNSNEKDDIVRRVSDNIEILIFLKSQGFNIRIAIDTCIFRQNLELLKFLIDKEACEIYENTFENACRFSSLEICKYLVEKGCDMSTVDTFNITNVDILKWFYEYGFRNINLYYLINSPKAFKWAIEIGYTLTRDIVLSVGAYLSLELLEYIYSLDLSLILNNLKDLTHTLHDIDKHVYQLSGKEEIDNFYYMMNKRKACLRFLFSISPDKQEFLRFGFSSFMLQDIDFNDHIWRQLIYLEYSPLSKEIKNFKMGLYEKHNIIIDTIQCLPKELIKSCINPFI